MKAHRVSRFNIPAPNNRISSRSKQSSSGPVQLKGIYTTTMLRFYFISDYKRNSFLSFSCVLDGTSARHLGILEQCNRVLKGEAVPPCLLFIVLHAIRTQFLFLGFTLFTHNRYFNTRYKIFSHTTNTSNTRYTLFTPRTHFLQKYKSNTFFNFIFLSKIVLYSQYCTIISSPSLLICLFNIYCRQDCFSRWNIKSPKMTNNRIPYLVNKLVFHG